MGDRDGSLSDRCGELESSAEELIRVAQRSPSISVAVVSSCSTRASTESSVRFRSPRSNPA